MIEISCFVKWRVCLMKRNVVETRTCVIDTGQVHFFWMWFPLHLHFQNLAVKSFGSLSIPNVQRDVAHA
jgi:hypothetical protein